MTALRASRRTTATSSGSRSPPSSATTTCGSRCCSTPCTRASAGCSCAEKGAAKSRRCAPGRAAAGRDGGRRLPLLLRPGRAGPALPGRSRLGPLGVCDDRADCDVRRRSRRRCFHRGRRTPAPPGRRAARRCHEYRLIGSLDLERAWPSAPTSPACSPTRAPSALRRRGQPAARPPRRPAPRRRGDGARARRTRRGVGVAAASFLLVGTMSPEEGELRPQLLDRFSGLTVEVRASRDVDARVEVVQADLASRPPLAAYRGTPTVTPARRMADARVPSRDAARRRAAPDRGGVRRVSTSTACGDLVIARATPRTRRGAGRTASRRRACGRPPGRRCPPAPAQPVRRAGDGRAGARRGARRRGPPTGARRAEPDGPDRMPVPDGPYPDGPGGGAPPTRPADAPTPSERGVGSADSAEPLRSGPGRLSRPGRADGRRAPPSTPFRARRLEVPGSARCARRRSRARTDTGRIVRPTDGTPRRAAELRLPATVAAAAPHQRPGAGPAAPFLDAATYAAASGRAARATSCCSPSTPPRLDGRAEADGRRLRRGAVAAARRLQRRERSAC